MRKSLSLKTRGKILVIRGGAIGDFILTVPAIAALRRQFPETHIEVLGYPHIAQLALAANLVDDVKSIEARAMSGFFARNGTLSPELSNYFSQFNVIISYLYDPDKIFETNVLSCTKANFIVGPHRPDESKKIHATKLFLRPLEQLTIFGVDEIPRLNLTPDPSHPARRIALHPGSGSEKKNWPEANWAQLIELILSSTDVNLLIVGGEAEGERLQRLAAALPPKRVTVAQSLPLPELGRLLQGCIGFVGHDSGISHLAAAVGLPCLILWGNSVEEIWRPQGEHVIIARNPRGLNSLSVEEVVEDLNHLLA